MENKYKFVFCLINWVCFSSAHVSMNFPKARMLNLDGLNPGAHKAPCGMPKGWLKTAIPSGMYMNFTWSMTYPHQGGYRIELWDRDYKWLANLTMLEPGQEFIKGNPTAQHHVVMIPEMPCQDCVVRLVRQANEFGQNGYFSCSDVDIIDRNMFRNRCNGHGIPNGNNCFCFRGFSGALCQYEEECMDDFDCGGGRGKCVYIGGTNYPSRQCFCAPGFHGEKCSRMNMAMLPTYQTLTLSMYKTKMVNEKVSLHYRMIPASMESMNEIEFVMEIMGTSFGALGMRPNSLDEKCKQWPAIDDTTMGGMSMANQNWMSKSQIQHEMKHNHTYTESKIKSRTNGAMSMSITQRMTRPSAYAPKMGMFHPMDCCDITVGAARGMFSRIRDYYTREVAVPLLDEAYGGWDDITSATGWEMNGKTTLIFRRKLMAVDLADHSISGEMHVIWSRGQESGMYVHALPSGLEAEGEMPMNKMFYTPDELKYHGHGTMQRGMMVLDFAA